MKRSLPLLLIAALLLATLLLRPRTETHSMQIFIMDTFVEILAEGSSDAAQSAIREGIQAIRRVDGKFGYNNSAINQLNLSGQSSDPEIVDLISRALEIHELSSGALSLTLRPMLDAWGFSGSHDYRLPTADELAHWRSLPQDEAIRLENGSVSLKNGCRIDLAAIAKGHAADMAARAMQQAGTPNGLINAGGDITTFGERVWQVGIRNPRGNGTIATLPVQARAVATSGDYERYFLADGRRYCHILDPATGYPATRYISATAIGDSGAVADAWATALFVAGADQELMASLGIDWILIDTEGNVSCSAAIRKFCPEKITVE